MKILMNKKIPMVLSALIVVFSLFTMSYSAEENIDYSQWKLVWVDDFDGCELDSTVWGVMQRQQDGGCRRYISSSPFCYDLKNGVFSIKAIKNTVEPNDTALYLTGGVYTRFKKSFAPGRIEIRAKFNGVIGKTCGLWMLPYKYGKGWPAEGEIDIMEHGAESDYITQTLHTSYTKAHPNVNPRRYIKRKVDYERFNTYGVDILEDRVEFHVNGKRTMVYPKVDSLVSEGQFPFFKDWYLLLSTASRGPFDSVCAPLEMEIDWIRYYHHR